MGSGLRSRLLRAGEAAFLETAERHVDAAEGYVAIRGVLDVCLQIRAVRFVFEAQHGEEEELLEVGQVGVIQHNWLAGLMWRSSDIYQIRINIVGAHRGAAEVLGAIRVLLYRKIPENNL